MSGPYRKSFSPLATVLALCFLCLLGSPCSSAAEPERRPNRLLREQSPYLLQHAYNPVDWFPWGEEAFQKAAREKKPIFLSIGYATCHWCHVMERESFGAPKIAAILNEGFVSIKVDREERPDIDYIYMSAAAGMGWGGGWPLNLFLTPEREPFYGGTYFPPEARGGQPSFVEVLQAVAQAWNKDPVATVTDAQRVTKSLRQELQKGAANTLKLDAGWLRTGYEALRDDFDGKHCGFGTAPKFPMPVNQDFLLRYYARTGDKKALELVTGTLRAMAAGGVYDQVGGGFHRYATDAAWRVPHFEKMLYDNAQLAVNYLEAYQVTRDPELARVARETLDYVLRDLMSPKGAFYSAEDADSLPPEAVEGEAREGAFYLWSATEIAALLGSSANLFKDRYGVQESGPNILYAARTVEETAKRAGRPVEETRRALEAARLRLLEARAKRPRPLRDDKVLASWNGLMISALAKGAQILDDRRYAAAAERGAAFIRSEMYDAQAKSLRHRWRAGHAGIAGMAADYAFVIQGLLDLYEADFDPAWLQWAIELIRTQDRLLLAEGGGLFMTTTGADPHLLARPIEDRDSGEPAPSSVAALNWLRLDQYTARREAFRKTAERTLERFGVQMRTAPRTLPRMLAALDYALSKHRQIVIAGKPGAPDTEAIIRAARRRFIPAKIVVLVDAAGPLKKRLLPLLPFIEGIVPIKGKAAAYVCVDFSCRLPTSDLAEFERQLESFP